MDQFKNRVAPPAVLLVGSLNTLTQDIIDELKNANLEIYFWETKYPLNINYRRHVKLDKKYTKVNDLPQIKEKHFDYLVYVNLNETLVNDRKHGIIDDDEIIKIMISITGASNPKMLFVFPNRLKLEDIKYVEKIDKKIIRNNHFNAASFYVPEPVGTDLYFQNGGLTELLLRCFIYNHTIPVSLNNLSFIESKILAKELVKNLFSFGNYRKSVLIKGKRLSLSYINKRLFINKTLPTERSGTIALSLVSTDESVKPECNQDNIINNLKARYDYLNKTANKSEDKNQELFSEKANKKKPSEYRQSVDGSSASEKTKITKTFNAANRIKLCVIYTIFIFAGIIISPLFSLFIVGSTQKLTSHMTVDNPSKDFIIYQSLRLNTGNIKYLNYLGAFPFVKNIYNDPIHISEIIDLALRSSYLQIGISQSSFKFYTHLLTDGQIDENDLVELKLDLEKLKLTHGFLQAELNNLGEFENKFVDRINAKKTLDMTADSIKSAEWILGVYEFVRNNNNATVAVVFQNENYLRPTGGKIEYIALVYISDGKINKVGVYNINDTQLKIAGEVTPPKQLEKYLGIENWYVNEANWDSDFRKSSEKISWFLEKATGVKVDNIIYLDHMLIDSIFANSDIGSIELISSSLNSDDVFSLLKYLTTLNIQELDRNLTIARANLQKKHLQVYSKNYDNLENSAVLGERTNIYCNDKCYLDHLAYVESNLDSKVASGNISRSFSLLINLDKGVIKRKLVINYKNKSDQIYKLYGRVIVPESSSVGLVKFDYEKNLRADVLSDNGRKEAGVYIEISPNDSVDLVYEWESPHGQNNIEVGQYILQWVKQPGTDEDSINLEINYADDLNFRSDDGYSLTKPGVISYNTNLMTDFSTTVYFYK